MSEFARRVVVTVLIAVVILAVTYFLWRGVVLVGAGVVWVLAPSMSWLGRLPGDIRIEGQYFRFYFPLATCLLLSLLLSLGVWLIRSLRGTP
jgi:hypothetical protein